MKIGKYSLIELVATGGMAELWLARQEGPAGFARTVAIKRVLPHLSSDDRFVEMFLDEARLAALLTHPNVVQIFDFGESDGDYFLAMEFIRGRSLDEVLDVQAEIGGRMPVEYAAYVVSQACLGLDYAHKFRHPDTAEHLKLVHRDVSPQNVMVSFDGLVKAMDFGIAKATTSKVKTQTGTVKGKYAYMSPEQIAGGMALDARSDVFALGIVLYEAMTGVRPFGTESDLVAITAILNEPPKPIREFMPEVDEELESVIERALAKDRVDRYVDAKAMHNDLQAYLQAGNTPVGADQISRYMGALFDVKDPAMAAAPAPAPPPRAPGPADMALAFRGTAIETIKLSDEAADTDAEVSTRISDTVDPLPTAQSREAIPAAGAKPEAAAGPLPPAAAVPNAPPTPRQSSGAGGLMLAFGGLAMIAALGGGAWWFIGGGAKAGATKADSGGSATSDSGTGAPAAEPAADPHEALEATLMGALSEGRGVIRILAEGGTAVFLDGRSLGPAPVPPQMVTAGAHTVRGLPPGGTPWEGSVTVLSKQKAMLRIP